jgi:RNA polymerase sigma factor (sigma-70 family)
MNKNSVITQVAFDEMLSWLDADREQAGKKYEKIRRRLIEIFASRGCPEAEDLADEAINRVVRKSQDVAERYVGDPAYYFYGVAKKILLEYWKVKPPTEAPLPPAPPAADEPADEIEREHMCLEQCLGHLPEQDRERLLLYYGQEQRVKIDQRKELSRRLGIAPNALRIRIHRIKSVLKDCLEDCMRQTTEG